MCKNTLGILMFVKSRIKTYVVRTVRKHNDIKGCCKYVTVGL